MHRSIILGVEIDSISKEKILQRIKQLVHSNKQHFIVTPNPEIVIKAQKDENYRQILNKSSISIPDGIGLLYASLILGTSIKERITGTDLVRDLARISSKNGWPVYFLGGEENIAYKAAQNLKKLFPELIIAGTSEGIAESEFEYESQDLIQEINRAKPKILLVAFGAPKQEKWIDYNLSNLESVKLAIGIGGAFDFISGNVKRAPLWMRKLGLEWLYRLFKQPWRIKRIFKATIVFMSYVVKWRIRMLFKYRKNVVGFITNQNNEFLVISPQWKSYLGWTIPQGGVEKSEKYEDAVLREMAEELGTTKDKFKIIKKIENFNTYKWPKWARLMKGYKGQKQTLFFLKFLGEEIDISVAKSKEIKDYKWVRKENLENTVENVRQEMVNKALKYI